MSWYVLGFDYDAVVGAWQDWRLARQCVVALQAAHRSPTIGIREGAGDGENLTHWYLDAEVAAVLDDAGVPWRRFVIGTIDAPPPEAARQLKAY
jgi:hypothetical protein